MRIAYIAAGAGGMLCGSCIRDNALVKALQDRGHDALLLPIYTPLRTDDENVASKRVFYGAINVYLQQKLPWLRHLPRPLHGLLDRPALLRRLAVSSSATDARELGELTLSMLQGEQGRQERELDDLVEWLADHFRPDVVHLTNAMLLGLAGRLREVLQVPVVCSLQGEDIFLDDLEPRYRERVLSVLAERASEVDALVATSAYYADHMAEYLGLERAVIDVARIGIHLEGHGPAPESLPSQARRIGYLARICPEKGLHELLAAFGEMVQRQPENDFELRAAGYLGGRDRQYFEQLTADTARQPWGDRFAYEGELDREAKVRFLQSLHVLSVPTTYKEPKGLFVLEALANGVPVVLPRHGAFPELVEATGGGLLVEPGSPQALATGLEQLLGDEDRRRELGERGREAVVREFGADRMAIETERVYERLLAPTPADAGSGEG
jgi:glycosyltransferase involved in cell wall biosynthesis